MTPIKAARWALLISVLLQGGCATAPRVNFYNLNAPDPSAQVGQSSLVLALGPVDLPQYLDRPQIVTRLGDNRLSVDEFNRWGGRLDEEITRVLAQHLGHRLGTQRIYSYPSRVMADTDYRIALDIRNFDGAPAGEVSLDVAWSVIDDRTGVVVQTRQAVYRGASAGPDYDAYAAALSATLARLGDDLVAVLAALAPSSR